jgi:carbamoyltransferase
LKPDVVVLGIHDGHDAGAALVVNGEVRAAVQEERLVNVKHYSGTPKNSIRLVFQIAGINPADVDIVAIAGLIRSTAPLVEEESFKVRAFNRLSPVLAHRSVIGPIKWYLSRSRKFGELEELLKELAIADREVISVDHHRCHAACAYRLGWRNYEEPTIVITADGAGDLLSSTVSMGDSGDLTLLDSSLYYDSVGNVFYSEVTRFLGMQPWDHEYKVMGLAPYGNPKYCLEEMKRLIDIDPSHPLRFKNKIGAYTRSVQPHLRRMLQYQRFDNVAAAAQEWFEELMTKWVKNAVDTTKVHRLAFAGGLFLNVKANKKIIEMADVDDAFFYPAAGDEGVAVGAAVEGYYQFCRREGKKPVKSALRDLYHGPSFDDEQIKAALKAKGLLEQADRYDDIDELVGERISKGDIVARFSGGLEWGPRALGNRSILGDARDYRVVWKVNFMIKQRDFWMPFAPSILEDRMSDYLVNPRSAPYMIMSFDTRAEKRDQILAGIHPKDFTVRPQTVNDWNPGYRTLIQRFEALTGVGGILNTSFNLHGYPIAGTPELAIWTYENSGLKNLAIGNYLLSKPNA